MTSSNLERLAATHPLKREAASQDPFAGGIMAGSRTNHVLQLSHSYDSFVSFVSNKS
jgi:hypothetical protein